MSKLQLKALEEIAKCRKIIYDALIVSNCASAIIRNYIEKNNDNIIPDELIKEFKELNIFHKGETESAFKKAHDASYEIEYWIDALKEALEKEYEE